MASIYDKQILTDKDIERIKELRRLWQETSDNQKKNEYHDAAEVIRRGYGYSGGGDGSELNPIEQSVLTEAIAAKDYTDALREAEKTRADVYAKQKEQVEADGNERLRQAYIKNMQHSLGLAQALKADGLTGGVTESTRAALGNNYLDLRDDIMKDVSDKKTDIMSDENEDKLYAEKEIAKADYESTKSRMEKMTAAEQRDYERALEEYRKKYQESKDAYDRQWQQKLFDYQKELDAYDREYQKQKDAADRQAALAKAYASKSSSSKSSSSSSDEKTEQLKKEAWKLLEKGVYDDSFPALLGYSKDMLIQYMENTMAGF